MGVYLGDDEIAITDIPLFISALRLFIGAVPLFVILLIKGRKRSIGKENIKHYLVMSLLMGLGYMGVLTYGMQFVDSGKRLFWCTPCLFCYCHQSFKLNEKSMCINARFISGLIGLCLY
ncbi:DMT family transporter [Bacillus licheniformis]|nr:DMT family transporter [Bacillus licheniformis]